MKRSPEISSSALCEKTRRAIIAFLFDSETFPVSLRLCAGKFSGKMKAMFSTTRLPSSQSGGWGAVCADDLMKGR